MDRPPVHELSAVNGHSLRFKYRATAGLRINGTASLPVGLYLATGKSPEKGDLVFVDPPSLPLFALAKERGYLGAGFSPAGCSALIKRLAGVAGDRVTIDASGVEVNGIRLANSVPLQLRRGRPALTTISAQGSHSWPGRGPAHVRVQSDII